MEIIEKAAPVTEQGKHRLLAYWPEVDGLRTVAVLAVLVFHFERSWLGGGFVGVDIFYAISGFLITTILLDDRDQGRFSIGRFYQRRISRIAPAFFLVLAATLIGAWAIYSDQDFASAGAAAAFAAISMANIKFMLMGDYFAVSPDAQPFLHYWSLAVEEQFYLFFPFLLYALTRWTRHTLKLTIALGLLSLVLCVAVTWVRPVYAFYLLPTRGWELLAGAAVATLRWRGIRMGDRLAKWGAWAGLALVLVSILMLREGPSFPGVLAVLPVAGTALILAAAGDPRAGLNAWLAKAPLVYIGKRSYSLYLWHWPVFSLVDYQLFQSGWWLRAALKIGITLALTWLSYRFVERPARRYLNQPARRTATFIGFAAIVAVAFAGGTMIRNAHYLDTRATDIATGGIEAAKGDRGNVVLIGDSQASMYARDIGLLAQQRGYSFHTMGIAAGDQLPGAHASSWDPVWAYLSTHKVDVVIFAEAWDGKLAEDPGRLRTALDLLASRGIRVILMQQIPAAAPGVDREGIRRGLRPPYPADPAIAADWARGRAFVAAQAGPGVTVIEIAPLFVETDGSVRLVSPNGRLNYQDPRHLSDTGTAQVIPLIDRAVAQALTR